MKQTKGKKIHTLFFSSAGIENPSKSLEIMDRKELSIPKIGIRGSFFIIGSSHYVDFGDVGYQELFSYNEHQHSDEQEITRINVLVNQNKQMYTETTREYNIYTTIYAQDIKKFDSSKKFDLHHRFEENAYTTISVGERFYSSCHTYPEKSVAVRTRTTFREKL